MARKKIRIGELLVENKVISEAQLRTALETQKKTGLKLGRQLIEAGYVTEDRFHEFLSHQLEIFTRDPIYEQAVLGLHGPSS